MDVFIYCDRVTQRVRRSVEICSLENQLYRQEVGMECCLIIDFHTRPNVGAVTLVLSHNSPRGFWRCWFAKVGMGGEGPPPDQEIPGFVAIVSVSVD